MDLKKVLTIKKRNFLPKDNMIFQILKKFNQFLKKIKQEKKNRTQKQHKIE